MSPVFKTIFNALLQEFDQALVVIFGILPLFGGSMLLIMYLHKRKYLNKIKQSGILEIDTMTGWEFEKFLEGLLQKRGYQVTHVGDRGNDFGADLVIEKNGVKTVIQAKRYRSRVGIKAIQEVVAAKRQYSCTKALLITNSYLTRSAWKLGQANYVSMWTRKKLIEEILATDSNKTTNLNPT